MNHYSMVENNHSMSNCSFSINANPSKSKGTEEAGSPQVSMMSIQGSFVSRTQGLPTLKPSMPSLTLSTEDTRAME